MTIPKGRPTKFNDELAAKICQLVAINPIGLRRLCDKYPELPASETINIWRWEKRDFSTQYAIAKQHQAELMVESFEEVIDDTSTYVYQDDNGVTRIDTGMIAQARLVIDTRKWTASKLAPKIYGDKKEVEQLQGENERVKAELAELRAKLDKANVSEY